MMSIVDEITEALRRYLVLPPHAAETIALWVVFTHTMDAWEHSPRLVLTSAGPESGKTTAMEIIEKLSAGGCKVDWASEAYVRRTVNQHKGKPFTLLLDEADTFFQDKPQLKSALNAGWKRGGRAGLTAVNPKKQIVPEELELWAPIAVAGIGEQWIWPALRTRSLVFQLRKKRANETVEGWGMHRHKKLEALRKRIERWAKDSLPGLKAARPDMPAELKNRNRDNWRPLIAIADAAGGEWPERARKIAVAMSDGQSKSTPGRLLLAAIRSIFEDEQADKIRSEKIVSALNASGHPEITSPHDLASGLKEFGIAPKQIRFGDVGAKGYQRSQFEPVWARCLARFDVSPNPGASHTCKNTT
jgi:hypothetical protein